MSATISFADGVPIEVGDRISIPTPVKRKWWQFWKPKWLTEQRVYRVGSIEHLEYVHATQAERSMQALVKDMEAGLSE